MSSTANYAATVRNGFAQVSTANSVRDGTGAMSALVVAGAAGSRVERIQMQAVQATTMGMLRFFKTKGNVGGKITSITSSATTVTVNTDAPHGRSNGELLYLSECYPPEYNCQKLPITVVTATQFVFTAPVAPVTAAASVLGFYVTTPAVPQTYLWREVPVSAATPTGTSPAWSVFASSSSDFGYFPAQLAPGVILQVSTTNAEQFNVFADLGNY